MMLNQCQGDFDLTDAVKIWLKKCGKTNHKLRCWVKSVVDCLLGKNGHHHIAVSGFHRHLKCLRVIHNG